MYWLKAVQVYVNIFLFQGRPECTGQAEINLSGVSVAGSVLQTSVWLGMNVETKKIL